MSAAVAWRILLVDDDEDIVEQIEKDAESGKLFEGTVTIESCTSFDDALRRVEDRRFDLLVLDLRDDRDDVRVDGEYPGVGVYRELRQRRFVPIVFYTALPEHIRSLESPVAVVVEKSKGIKALRKAIAGVMATGLPSLSRHLEEEQRAYMWEFIGDNWKSLVTSAETVELAYLLGRRLARVLERDSIRRYFESKGESAGSPETVMPVEMYVIPPVPNCLLAGDVLRGSPKKGKSSAFWVVLTPSCDLEQGKAEYVLLALCMPLSEEREYQTYVEYVADNKPPSNSAKGKLVNLLSDNRSGQRGRYKFLPSVLSMPDLVVDFQALVQPDRKAVEKFERVASLDSPFGEALLARFAAYYGRIGTPDLDADAVLRRIREAAANTPRAKTTVAGGGGKAGGARKPSATKKRVSQEKRASVSKAAKKERVLVKKGAKKKRSARKTPRTAKPGGRAGR